MHKEGSMRHGSHEVWPVTLAGALAVLLAFPASTAAQPATPVIAAWEGLRDIVSEGSTVVVRTRDGNRTSGRVRSLSDTAIVVDRGRTRTIQALEVVSIEGDRGPRPFRRGARVGIKVGLFLAGLYSAAAADTDCLPEECVNWSDALAGAFILPAMGAGVGAAIGVLIPGKRTLLYSAGAPGPLTVVPIASRGRRGGAVRVAF
jgi:hypothetical protein